MLVSQELTKELLLKASMEETLDVEPVEKPGDAHNVEVETQSSPRSPSSIRSYVKSMLSPLMPRTPSSNWSNVQVCTLFSTRRREKLIPYNPLAI